ncbi:hypothetical protein DRQ26_06055 [bacterium]|nr:MAG: hypothetical protein DRQ26_06055 [bacterium]
MKKLLKHRFGVTITEVMVIVVILGILVASTSFILRRVGRHFRLTGAATQFKQDCTLARQMALEKNKTFLVRCFPDSTPQFWQIFRVDSAGFFSTDNRWRYELHRLIYFGVGSDVSGSTGPDGNPIPSDGVSFPANALALMPRRGAPQPGVVYLTDGTETRAVLVNSMGSATVMQYKNGSWQ